MPRLSMEGLVTLPAELSKAERMLAEARTVADFRDLRGFSTTLRAWAKARGLGIESENEAAVFILRAERGAGKELIRMAEAGELVRRGWSKGGEHGRFPKGVGADQGATLADLGIIRSEASDWRALATMQDDAFDAAIADAMKPGPDGRVRRLAKWSIYQAASQTRGLTRVPGGNVLDDPVAPFEMLRAAVESFLNSAPFGRLSPDDVMGVGKLGVRLVKAARSEMDQRS